MQILEAIVTLIHGSVTCVTCHMTGHVPCTSLVFNTFATPSHPPWHVPNQGGSGCHWGNRWDEARALQGVQCPGPESHGSNSRCIDASLAICGWDWKSTKRRRHMRPQRRNSLEIHGNTDYSFYRLFYRSVRFWAFAIWHVSFDLLRWENWHAIVWNTLRSRGRYQPAPAGHSRSTYLGVEYSDATGAKESQPWEHPSVPRSIAVLSFLSGVFFRPITKKQKTDPDRVKPCKTQSIIYLKWPWP